MLAENNRLSLYHKIMSSFFELVSAEIGQVACTITSAEVLAGCLVSAPRPAVWPQCAHHGCAARLSVTRAPRVQRLSKKDMEDIKTGLSEC